jgi:NAD(P)H-dependent FMN reductase
MPVLLTLSGSLRAESLNGRVLALAAQQTHERVHAFHGLARLSWFDPALDQVPPPPVAEFRALVKAADAVLISTPEYAHGVPGALKNGLDWMVGSGELMGKPTGVLTVSATDGAYARDHLVEVLRTMAARVPRGAVRSIQGLRQDWPLGTEAPKHLLQTLQQVLGALGVPLIR